MRPSLDLLNEALAGRYRVHRELGRRGMSRVFVGGRPHARWFGGFEGPAPRVRGDTRGRSVPREIEILRQLSHPSIVPILDSDEAGARLYLVMPYVPGERDTP